MRITILYTHTCNDRARQEVRTLCGRNRKRRWGRYSGGTNCNLFGILFYTNIIGKKVYWWRDGGRTPVGHRTYVDRRRKRLVAAARQMSAVGARDVTSDRRRHSHHGSQRQPPELQGGHPRRRSLVSAATLVSCAQHALPLSHHLTLSNYISTNKSHHLCLSTFSNICYILYIKHTLNCKCTI